MTTEMTNDQSPPRAGDGKTDPSGATYRIETVADMLKVPAERRGVMLRELETTLLTHEFTASLASDTGFEWPALKGLDWTDDGDHAAHVSVNGEPLLSLKITKNSEASDPQSVECPPDPEWVDEQLAAAPAAAPAWQPIETAPKDGTHILVSAEGRVSLGGWLTDVDHGAEWEGQIGMSGWWAVDLGPHNDRPTHWMPLPAAPEIPCAATVAQTEGSQP